MTYLCPKCGSFMNCISTLSIPSITKYVCSVCGYTSREVREYEDC